MNRFDLRVCLAGITVVSTFGCGDDARSQSPGPSAVAGASTGGGAGTSSGGQPSSGSWAGGASGGTAGMGGDLAGSAGSGGGAAGAAMIDPCQGVTVQGECVSTQQTRACVVPTGNGNPMLVTTNCRAFEHCDASNGSARCVLNDEACVPDQSACAGKQKLMTCDKSGAWQIRDCPGACRDSAIGGFCVEDTPTTTFSGSLFYEQFAVQDNYEDWANASSSQPAEGVLVLSGDGAEWLDAALVDASGAFTVNVSATKTGQEKLAFFLTHPDPTAAYTELGVFEPNVGDGKATSQPKLDGKPWSWTQNLSDLPPGGRVEVTEREGSGAIHTYKQLLQVQRFLREFYGEEPGTLLVWFRMNTSWDCGTCFMIADTEVSATPFGSQMFIPADATDRSYWSDAVTVHEAGHYTMWSYGTPPNEGGPHCLGHPSPPGLAWSEGWATGFSSLFRRSSIYYDKQGGSMFWLDIDKRKYEKLNWQRPDPNRGLMQDIDENEIAAMLWELSREDSVGADDTLLAVRNPSVTQPKFKRGYTTHAWNMNNCVRSNYRDTGKSAPMFADYLDGLMCTGSSAAAIDAVTQPQQAYPYPSDKPLCP